MERGIEFLRNLVHSSTNRISFSAAVRGVIATATPIIVLRLLGFPIAAVFATFAGLNVSIADSGGPYRTRLRTMGLIVVFMPVVIFAGTQVRSSWWMATLLMFLIAFSGGMARTLGQTGFSVGLIGSLVFLVGLEISGPVLPSLEHVAFYYLGGAWAILLTLLVWRLRPYKRFELEVASSLNATAGLLGATQSEWEAALSSQGSQHQAVVKQHRAVRDAIEQTRATLGETLHDVENVDATISQLIVLLRAASRISTAALGLEEMLSTDRLPEPTEETRQEIDALLSTIQEAIQAQARALTNRAGNPSFDILHEQLEQLELHVEELHVDNESANGKTVKLESALIPFRQILRHLENGRQAIDSLLSQERRLGGLLPPLNQPASSSEDRLESLRSNLNPDSLIFRHALRVAIATASGTAMFILLDLPHGIWIPLTTLLVLQPNFGATLQRAFNRTAGTLLGAGLASLFIATLHAPYAKEAAIVGVLFFTFFFFRRQYGVAVMFLTPLIILLLDLVAPNPWQDIVERIRDTLIGAGFGLAVGYLLWPVWEHHRLPEQFADALDANRAYLSAVLQALASGPGSEKSLHSCRRQAEIETGNAEVAFQHMLDEPKHKRAHEAFFLTLITYIRSLNQHATRLAVYQQELSQALPELQPLVERLDGTLEDVARAVVNNRPAGPPPSTDEIFAPIHAALSEKNPSNGGQQASSPKASQAPAKGLWVTFDHLLDQIVGDVNSLHAATLLKD